MKNNVQKFEKIFFSLVLFKIYQGSRIQISFLVLEIFTIWGCILIIFQNIQNGRHFSFPVHVIMELLYRKHHKNQFPIVLSTCLGAYAHVISSLLSELEYVNWKNKPNLCFLTKCRLNHHFRLLEKVYPLQSL